MSERLPRQYDEQRTREPKTTAWDRAADRVTDSDVVFMLQRIYDESSNPDLSDALAALGFGEDPPPGVSARDWAFHKLVGAFFDYAILDDSGEIDALAHEALEVARECAIFQRVTEMERSRKDSTT